MGIADLIQSPSHLARLLEAVRYVAEEDIVMTLYIALKLEKPLLVEGEPGSGKTELAKVLAEGLGTELIRLQCYEGLDVNTTIYEWDYLRQLLRIRMEEGRRDPRELEGEIFSERFLLKRPLLQAVMHEGGRPPVLLIDEIDRADEEFESFLLEFLGEFQVTIPELGTFKAKQKPIVIITSNRTRELGDGLRRRCLYLYITYPSFEKELKILRLKIPGIEEQLARQLVGVVNRIRALDFVVKKPGIAETLDWAAALMALNVKSLDVPTLDATLSCLVKSADELARIREQGIGSLLLDQRS